MNVQVSSGTSDGMAKLTDPSNKIIYEMHQYLDSDGSGTSTACVSTTIGKERLEAATAWLKANGKKAILGETAGGANAQCIAALQGMLAYMGDNSDVWTGWLWWGAGPVRKENPPLSLPPFSHLVHTKIDANDRI